MTGHLGTRVAGLPVVVDGHPSERDLAASISIEAYLGHLARTVRAEREPDLLALIREREGRR